MAAQTSEKAFETHVEEVLLLITASAVGKINVRGATQ